MRKSIAALVVIAVLAGYLLKSYTYVLFAIPVTLAGSIFFKNALAAIVTVYLGTFLSYLELLIYRRTSEKTYSMLDRLTEPLYAVLSRFATFRIASPLRACLFYLYFVPSLSLFANLTAISAFFWSFAPEGVSEFISYLMPHALLEIPAMLGSIALGLAIANKLRGVAMRGDVETFEKEIRALVRKPGYALGMLLILVLLYFAALLESG
jgi:uncharacterized membrane protein SpoIIM required for sporulation